MRLDVPFEADAQVAVVLVNEHLELVVRELVARFKLAIVLAPLLHSVVSQVHQPIRQVVNRVLPTRGAKVALLVDVDLVVPVHRGHHHKRPYVELPPVNEQRVVNVLLDDTSPPSRGSAVLDQRLDLLKVLCNLDTVASVGVLTRLDDPDVPRRQGRGVISGLFGFLALLLVFLLVLFLGTVVWTLLVFCLFLALLSFLLLGFSHLLLQGLLHLVLLLSLGVKLLESLKLWVRKARLDVESDWQVMEHVLLQSLVVVLHVKEQGFLVVQVEVVLNFVVEPGLKELLDDLSLILLVLFGLLLVSSTLFILLVQT